MQILHIVVVVDVQRREPSVTERSYRVRRVVADKSAVTEIKADGEISRVERMKAPTRQTLLHGKNN